MPDGRHTPGGGMLPACAVDLCCATAGPGGPARGLATPPVDRCGGLGAPGCTELNATPAPSRGPEAGPGTPVSVNSAQSPSVFSADLRALIARFDEQPVQLATLLEATQGRGYHLLLVLIALPFVGPIPLPGFSIPFGLTVALLGARLAVNKKPWLPRRLLQRELPPHSLAKLLGAASRIMGAIEYFLKPRLGFVPNHAVFGRIAGLLIAISGLMLMLPFPLPFSNSLPAWTVLLLAAGALGRDGLFFFGGCAAFAVSLVFFTLVALGGSQVIDALFAFACGG